MMFAIETLIGFSSLVLQELELRGVKYTTVYRDPSTVVIQCDDAYTSTLRRLQTATEVEKILLEVDYTRDLKTLRKNLREVFRNLRGFIPEGALVSVKFVEISKKIQRIILRELERVLRCKLTRAKGDYELSARFLFRKIVLGVKISSFQPLYRRWYTRYKSRASLNPVIAAAMCLVAGEHKHVMDPFAGSLTIPIEYCRMWRPERVTCVDIDGVVLARSIANAEQIEQAWTRLDIVCGDYLRINLRETYDCIVTDPPRGLRLRVSRQFYEKMIDKFRQDLRDGGVVVLPVFRQARGLLRRLFAERGFQVEFPASTIQGGIKVYILKATKTS